jgi:hypothetical protein
MFFLITHKLPFVWECTDHGEGDHTIQLKRFNSRFHYVTVCVVCCACYKEARTSGTYPYTEFDLDTYEWTHILDELHLEDTTLN